MRPTTVPTVLRGLRSRALLSATSLAMMVLAVAGAVLGPMFQQAATDSYTLTRLDEAPPATTALSWQAGSPDAAGPAGLAALVEGAVEEVRRLQPPEYSPPQVYVLTTPTTRAADDARVRLLARDDVCAALDVEGRCPETTGEVLLHEDDLRGLAPGDTVEAPPLGRLEIVGTYTTPSSTDDWLYPALLSSAPATPTDPYRPAPFVVTQDAVGTTGPGLWSPQLESRLLVPDRVDEARLDQLAQETLRLASLEAPFDGGVLRGTSQANALGGVVDEVRGQRDAARSALAPAVVSLVLVALAMILRLQVAADERRGGELALAALRGLGPRRAWVLGLAEPWLLVLMSLPLGVLVGVAGTRALAAAWLRDGTAVGVPAGSLLAAGAVALALLAISASAVGRGLRQSLGARLTGAGRPRPSGRAAALAELVVVLLAVTLPLSTLGADGGLGAADLLLPVAAAVAAGLLATRAVRALAQRWTTGGAQRPLAVFVAARAVARRAQGTLVVLPVCAAVAVAVFAVGTSSAASAWRASVAATASPGDEVYVSPRLLDETMYLTQDLDPEGRHLMALAEVSVPGYGVLVAVDSARLARVGDWQPQWLDGAAGAEAAALVAPAEPLRRLTGNRLAVTTDTDAAGATVRLGLRTPGGVRSVPVGPLPAGRATTEVRTDSCERGCLLVALTGDPGRAVTVSEVTADGRPADPALGPGGPVALEPGEEVVAPAAADPLPVLVGLREDGLLDGGAVETGSGAIEVRVAGTAESLPLVGPAGVMTDLATLVSQVDPPPLLVRSSVVARADTPDDVRDGLARAGLVATAGEADTRRVLDGTAYAQALRLYLVVAAVLLVMALGGLVVSNAVQLPARRRDAASLRVVGVPPRTLVAGTLAENAVVLGVAALAGLAAGAGALAVLLPRLELGVVDDARTPRVLPDPDVGALVLVAGGVAVALLAVAVLTSLAVVRRARAATLREAAG